MNGNRTYGSKKMAAVAMILSVLLLWMAVSPTAYAFVEGDANSETVIVEENVVEETEATPFSVSGNGEVLDDITDEDSKEFFTITTKNGSTYFLVIDRSSTTENVYLLSMIDEYDLQDFLDETEATAVQTEEVLTVQTETEAQAAVIIPETAVQTEEVETEGVIVEEESGTTMLLLMIVAAVIIAGALYFYFRVYRPGEEEDGGESENLETSTENLSTERDSDE